jgi:hypothetical protein
MKMDQNDINDLEQYRDTERKRERERQIRAQAQLPQGPTQRERDLADLDRWDAIWKRTRNGY